MTTPVRLIATDLDGTLLRRDATISPRNVAAVRAAHDAGIAVVAATGRGWRSATPLLEPVPEIRTGVLSNGAVVRDLRDGQTTHTFPLGGRFPEAVERVCSLVPGIGLGWEQDGLFGFNDAYADVRPALRTRAEARIGVPPLHATDVVKLLVCHADHDELALIDLLASLSGDFTIASSGGDLVEITAAGVHKAAALAVVCDDLGIDPSEVLALGDNGNDAEMLRWAGLGVAMGNAVPAALEVADEVTDHHLDDGVAVAIERLLA